MATIFQNLKMLGGMGTDISRQYLQQMQDIISGKTAPQNTQVFNWINQYMNQLGKKQEANYIKEASSKGITGGALEKGLTDIYSQQNQGMLQALKDIESGTWQQAGTAGESAIKNQLDLTKTMMGAYLQKHAIGKQEHQAEMERYRGIIGQGASGVGSAVGGCQCRIFTEDWTKELEIPVRKFRDEHYSPNSYVSKGYNLSSELIVPLMMKFKSIRVLIRKIMLKPMSKFAKLYYKKDKKYYLYSPVCLFWTVIWDQLGRLDAISK